MTRNIRKKEGYLKLTRWNGTTRAADRTSDLENALRSALAAMPGTQRLFEFGPDNQIRRAVLDEEDSHGGICGRLIEYEKGKAIETITVSAVPTDQMITSTTVLPQPEEQGLSKDQIAASLYFVVRGNNVSLLQSTGLRSNAFADYLTFLLSRNNEVTGGKLLLSDHISRQSAAQIAQHGVDSIRIGASLSDAISRSDVNDDQGILDLTQNLMMRKIHDLTTARTMDLRNADLGGLTVNVEVKAQTRAGDESKRLLDTLALGIINDLSGVVITLNNGDEIKGETLIKRGDFDVEFFDGIPAVTQVFSGLSTLFE